MMMIELRPLTRITWKQARMKRNNSFVIGVSANSNPEDFLPGERAGMNGFMAKPVNFNLLRDVLDMISRREYDKVGELLKAWPRALSASTLRI